MKTTKLVILFFTICASSVMAQDYQTVRSDRIAYFDNQNGDIKCIRIDSVKNQADSVFYFMSNIQEKEFHCFTPYGASWVGDKVIIQNSGFNSFFNKNQDTIKIKTDALLGESWVSYEITDSIRVIAKILKYDTLQFLGQLDSIKTVGFKVYDKNMNLLDYALNAMEMQISRSFGLVNTLNFYLFPNLYTSYPYQQFEEYTLVGFSNPNIGVGNLKWFEVYDFQINDELHVLDERSDWGLGIGYSRSIKNIFKYLERFDYIDSLVYSYSRKQSIHTIWADSNSFIFTEDTLKMIVKPDSLFDKFPGEPIINEYEAYSYLMTNGSELSKTNLREYESFGYSSDGCWYMIVADGCLRANRYIKGLGGPYFQCENAFSLGGEKRELVYYKKGQKTWGAPLVVTAISNTIIGSNISVFPAPAKDFITIRLQDFRSDIVFEIFDFTGRLVMVHNIDSFENKLSIENLKSGIYFYRLGTKNDILKSDKLIIE